MAHLVVKIGPVSLLDGRREGAFYLPLSGSVSPEQVAFATDDAAGITEVAAASTGPLDCEPALEDFAEELGGEVREPTEDERVQRAEVALSLKEIPGFEPGETPGALGILLASIGQLIHGQHHGELIAGLVFCGRVEGTCSLGEVDLRFRFWATLDPTVNYHLSLKGALGEPISSQQVDLLLVGEPDYLVEAVRTSYGSGRKGQVGFVPRVLWGGQPLTPAQRDPVYLILAAICFNGTSRVRPDVQAQAFEFPTARLCAPIEGLSFDPETVRDLLVIPVGTRHDEAGATDHVAAVAISAHRPLAVNGPTPADCLQQIRARFPQAQLACDPRWKQEAADAGVDVQTWAPDPEELERAVEVALILENPPGLPLHDDPQSLLSLLRSLAAVARSPIAAQLATGFEASTEVTRTGSDARASWSVRGGPRAGDAPPMLTFHDDAAAAGAGTVCVTWEAAPPLTLHALSQLGMTHVPALTVDGQPASAAWCEQWLLALNLVVQALAESPDHNGDVEFGGDYLGRVFEGWLLLDPPDLQV